VVARPRRGPIHAGAVTLLAGLLNIPATTITETLDGATGSRFFATRFPSLY
jgi:hypothetical protein